MINLMSQKIDISHKTIIFIAAFMLGFWTIYLIRDLLIVLFVAIILMSALTPLVNLFVKIKIPKWLSIAVTYIIIIGVSSGAIAFILQPLIEESSRLVVTLPQLSGQILNIANIEKSVFQSELTNL